MNYDEAIRHNEKILAELEARRDLARAAEAMHRTEGEKTAPRVEHPEAKDIPLEPDAPQTYQTQTYEVAAPNEVVVTQEARLPESSEYIQKLIDAVKEHLEILRQGKDWAEIDKESITRLFKEWKETQDENKDFKIDIQALLATPGHPEAQWVSDAHSHPHPDPITAGFLMSGLAVGFVSDILGAKGIAEGVKDAVEKAKEAYETANQSIKDSIELQKFNVAYEVEKAKEAYEAGKQEIKDGIELQKINVAYEKEVIKEGVEKAQEAIKDAGEKAKDMVGDAVAALADPALAAKEKEQAAAREKLEADLKEEKKRQEERWKGKGEDEKAALMQRAEKAAQAMRDQMIAKQAEELERMRRMEELHRPRW